MVKNLLSFESKRMPFAKLFAFFSAGILCGRFVQAPPTVITFLPYGILTVMLFLLFTEYKNKVLNRRIFPKIGYVLLAILGFYAIKRDDPAHQEDYFGKQHPPLLIGLIKDEPIYKEKSIRFPVEVSAMQDSLSRHSASGTIMVTVKRGKNDINLFHYGDRIVFKNSCTPVVPAYNPNQFNYKRYLENKNIHYQTYLTLSEIRVIASDEGNPVLAFALQARKHLADKFSKHIPETHAFQISAALIFGYRTDMNPEILQAFTNTGTIHVLSVSGLHVGIVFALLHYLLQFMDRFPMGRTLRFCLTLGAIWSYVILTGMAPAILRAGIMITFFVVAAWTNRTQQNLNTLFASAFFILLFDPRMLLDVGFQLSYAAVLGLFTLYPLLQHSFPIKNKYAKILTQYIFISIAAQLFTAPLALFYFHQFPNYFLLGNLFIAIPSTLTMYMGLALAISPFETLNDILGKALERLVDQTYLGLQKIDALPYAVWQGIDFGIGELLLFSLGILLLTITWNNRQKAAFWGCLACAGILVMVISWQSIQRQSFKGITFYNTQHHLTMALFASGKAPHVLSTLDSLTHPQLLFHMWPDLQRYTRPEKTAFSPLDNEKRENKMLKIADISIAILEKKQLSDKLLKNADIIIWRYGNYTDMHSVKNAFLIFDGSNFGTRLADLTAQADVLGISYYVLKDNFAYVWERKK